MAHGAAESDSRLMVARRNPRPEVETYFGPAYLEAYRRFLMPMEQDQAESAFLLDALRPRAGERWLDLPCGYGRHLTQLAKLAPKLRLFGGDLCLPHLREARSIGARLMRLDMRRLPLADRSIDAVLCLLNSFGYYPPAGREGPATADDRTTLNEIARVLKPGRPLVLDLPNRQALLGLVRNEPDIRYTGDDFEVFEHFEWDAAGRQLVNRTRWVWEQGEERAGYRVRLYTPAEIQRLLARKGFAIEAIYGDFEGEPFCPQNSDRLLVISRLT